MGVAINAYCTSTVVEDDKVRHKYGLENLDLEDVRTHKLTHFLLNLLVVDSNYTI